MGDDRPVAYEENNQIIYRASGVGMCSNLLYYARVNEYAAPTPDWLQLAYDQGNEGEDVVVRLLENDGRKIDLRQHEINLALFRVDEIRNVFIRGHIDGVDVTTPGKPFLIEIKCFAPSYLEKFHSQGLRGFPTYLQQVSIYATCLGLEEATLVIGVKDEDGKVIGYETHDVSKDLVPVPGDLRDKLMRIEMAVKKGEVPGDCDVATYPCPYYWKHPEEEGEENPELDVLAETYNDLTEHIKALQSEKDDLRDKIMEAVGEGETKTKMWKVTRSAYFQKRVDMKALKKDIDVEKYEVENRVDRLTVTPMTKRDEMDSAEVK